MHLRISQRFLLQTLVILLSLGLSVLSSSSSESENAGPSGFDKLTVGKNTYYKVRVNAVTPDAITIFHSKGITKVPLSKLSPDLQKAFNFDPEESANYLQEQRQRSEQAIAERQRLMKAAQARSSEKESSDLLQKLNAPIELKESMDLRPRIRELSLISKSQGLRPSCAVFAVVSALEIQSARHTNRAARLSEEYLIWATRKSLGLTGEETVTITGLDSVEPLQALPCHITFADGSAKEISLKCRIDTAIEVEYIEHGGVLHYVLRNLAKAA